jgi:hypothetical protein
MERTLHGKELSVFLLPYEKDFSNITPTEQLDLLKARWTNLNLVKRSVSEKNAITNRGKGSYRFDLDGITRVCATEGHLIRPTDR